MFLVFRKWFSKEEDLQKSSSVFGAAVFSPADCSHSIECLQLPERSAAKQHLQPHRRERPDINQDDQPNSTKQSVKSREG